MVPPMGMRTYLISLGSPYSVENGASNGSTVKFSFDIHLNMAHPIEAKVCLGFIVNWSWRSLSVKCKKYWNHWSKLYSLRHTNAKFAIFAFLCHNVYKFTSLIHVFFTQWTLIWPVIAKLNDNNSSIKKYIINIIT